MPTRFTATSYFNYASFLPVMSVLPCVRLRPVRSIKFSDHTELNSKSQEFRSCVRPVRRDQTCRNHKATIISWRIFLRLSDLRKDTRVTRMSVLVATTNMFSQIWMVTILFFVVFNLIVSHTSSVWGASSRHTNKLNESNVLGIQINFLSLWRSNRTSSSRRQAHRIATTRQHCG